MWITKRFSRAFEVTFHGPVAPFGKTCTQRDKNNSRKTRVYVWHFLNTKETCSVFVLLPQAVYVSIQLNKIRTSFLYAKCIVFEAKISGLDWYINPNSTPIRYC